MKTYLENLTVTLHPNIDKFEDELVSLLNEDRINRDNTVADGSSVTIAERRIMVSAETSYHFSELFPPLFIQNNLTLYSILRLGYTMVSVTWRNQKWLILSLKNYRRDEELH